MDIDKTKREEWEAHIHYLSVDGLTKLFCEYLECDIDSVTGLNVRMFLETKTVDMDMLAIWIGHMRGSMYGNFSIRHKGKIIEYGPGFHCHKELFDFYLSLPLEWYKIIDSKIIFSDNQAEMGIDLPTGEFQKEVSDVSSLSCRVLKEEK